jgi:hypothetical protein
MWAIGNTACLEVLLLWKSVPLSCLLSSSHSIRISNFVQLILCASCTMSNSNLCNNLYKPWKLNTVDVPFPSYMFWHSVQSAHTLSVRTLHLSVLWVVGLDDHRPPGENVWTPQHSINGPQTTLQLLFLNFFKHFLRWSCVLIETGMRLFHTFDQFSDAACVNIRVPWWWHTGSAEIRVSTVFNV